WRTGYVLLTRLQSRADKRCGTVQHRAMHVVCPHCQAAYQLEGVDEGTILICHRCGTEFGFGQPPDNARAIGDEHPDKNENEEYLPLFSADPTSRESAPDDKETSFEGIIDGILADPDDNKVISTDPEPETELTVPDQSTEDPDRMVSEETSSVDQRELSSDTEEPGKETTEPASAMEEAPEDEDALPPPPRANVRIMPWLLTIMLLIATAGFWSRHDAWLDDPWLRSVLINVGLPVKVRDKDWHIQPESIRAQWVKREDGSQVLVIEGRVKNLLQCELAPPAIRFSIFVKNDPEHMLLQRELPVSQPPLMVAIRRTPYIVPPEDHVPVTALGDRGFVLVLEGLPKNAGDFTLTPIARGGA
ncbi:MAG: hypothetical protein Q9M24_03035, partial [Mariprofundaceae bacterium]|nr:hypothetical protein [Mariprofundaceae bacterium]